MGEWAPNPADALAKYQDRIANVATIKDGLAILTDLMADQGRRGADVVFLKVNGEEDWTLETAQQLADYWVHSHLNAIVETVHAWGGTRDMAEAMAEAAVTAFGKRLQELAGAFGPGGMA